MAAARKSLASLLVEWIGPGIVEIGNAGDGWPSHLRIKTPSGSRDVAAHLGPIGASHRKRDSVERRFQNPGKGKPIQAPPNEIPLLLGLSAETKGKPLIVGMDPTKRVGKTTRQSLFVPLHLLESAAATGWAEHFSDAGERLIAFSPSLLPAYVELRNTGTSIPERDIQAILEAAGTEEPGANAESLERGMRSAMRLIRDAAFSKEVRKAYGGLCAMCGLNFSLVAGAHIYPVSAPKSADKIWNGLALCHNHHSAFDSHLIWVDPNTYAVVLHSDIRNHAKLNAACQAFVETTLPELQVPAAVVHRPRAEMFSGRYAFFKSRYSWADT
jgi:hypothetical protein